MLSRRTSRGPSTGRFQIPVCTVRPCQETSLGIPTLTDTTVAMAALLYRGSVSSLALESSQPRESFVARYLRAGEATQHRQGGGDDGERGEQAGDDDDVIAHPGCLQRLVEL